MHGQRAPLNENGDGEVDENFWAQAAADQAAGRAALDGDDGEVYLTLCGTHVSVYRGFRARWR